MGESLIETLSVDKKMEESVKSGSRLEVSVSFGRFEKDAALCWEKWSTFSPNKYLEEIGSLSTPGSVAQKKAYFEAHYKKIAAAKKAEELEQEKPSNLEELEPAKSSTVEELGPAKSSTVEELGPAKSSSSEELGPAKSSSSERLGPAKSSNSERLGLTESSNLEELVPAESSISEELVQAKSSTSEELGPEKSSNSDTPTPDESSSEDLVENSSATRTSVLERLGEEYAAATNMSALTIVAHEVNKDDNSGAITSEEKPAIALECRSSITGEVKDQSNGDLVSSELTVSKEKESLLTGVENPRMDSPAVAEKAQVRRYGREHSHVLEKENPKLKNVAQKGTPTEKIRKAGTTRKSVVSPVVKSSQASTPKSYPKPTSMSTPKTATQSLKTKVNGSPLLKTKNSQAGENKRMAPTSLHMSLSLGPANSSGPADSSSSPVPVTRKSLIMEQMGDKDIVRRAFKSFQKYTNGLSYDEKSSTVKQVQSTPLKSKVSTSLTPAKGNEGLRKDVEKVATQRTQSGTRSKPVPSRSDKSAASKTTMSLSRSTDSRSDDKAEKRKEFFKKLEKNSIAREAEKARLSAKPKEEKESAIRKLRQSQNIKAKPFPSCYRSQGN